jgi:hypothetical protein
LPGLLLCVLCRPAKILLSLIDPLSDLLTGLAGGGLHIRLRHGDALLERVQSFGKLHLSSSSGDRGLSRTPSPRRTGQTTRPAFESVSTKVHPFREQCPRATRSSERVAVPRTSF